jgi:L,D-peptidoglycan transpeptidase YkuD (ErfK/YbiS/YcfS/YnhG family)
MGSIVFPITYRTRLRDRPLAAIRIHAAAGSRRRGWLLAGPQMIPVALGRGGILANKREGDGGTRPRSFLPTRAIAPDDAWSEDPADRHYNQPIRLNGDAPGDRLKRSDHLYDFIIEIDHNTRPRIAGRGSAVFLHLARDQFAPTAGCVGMTKAAMLRLLARIGPRTRIVIE